MEDPPPTPPQGRGKEEGLFLLYISKFTSPWTETLKKTILTGEINALSR
jgi:hypothetical protein